MSLYELSERLSDKEVELGRVGSRRGGIPHAVLLDAPCTASVFAPMRALEQVEVLQPGSEAWGEHECCGFLVVYAERAHRERCESAGASRC